MMQHFRLPKGIYIEELGTPDSFADIQEAAEAGFGLAGERGIVVPFCVRAKDYTIYPPFVISQRYASDLLSDGVASLSGRKVLNFAPLNKCVSGYVMQPGKTAAADQQRLSDLAEEYCEALFAPRRTRNGEPPSKRSVPKDEIARAKFRWDDALARADGDVLGALRATRQRIEKTSSPTKLIGIICVLDILKDNEFAPYARQFKALIDFAEEKIGL